MSNQHGADRNGYYSGNIFDERKRYLGKLQQQGKEAIDRDANDAAETLFHQLQRALQRATGRKFFSTSFQIIGAGLPNNFNIDGLAASVGDPETYAHGWADGLHVILTADREFAPTPPVAAQFKDEIFHKSTGLDALTLTDINGKWQVNELVGRTLYPNVDSATGFTIISNTATSITTAGDHTTVAAVGDYYRIGLTTPVGSDRTDYAYLDVHVMEWNATEDPDLLHPVGTGIESARRLKVIQWVRVIEDGSIPADYVDTQGNLHYIVPLAQIDRDDGDPNISAAMVTDLRDPWFGSSPEIEIARGLMSSLEERIYRTYDPYTGLPVTDGVIMPDGTLNPDAVELTIPHDKLSNMPDTITPPSAAVADHDARYGNLTYSAGPSEVVSGVSAVQDDESHRDAIARLNAGVVEAFGLRVLIWMND